MWFFGFDGLIIILNGEIYLFYEWFFLFKGGVELFKLICNVVDYVDVKIDLCYDVVVIEVDWDGK